MSSIDLAINTSAIGFTHLEASSSNAKVFKNKKKFIAEKFSKKDSQHFVKFTAKETKIYTFKIKRPKKKKYLKRYFSLIKHYGYKIVNSKKQESSDHIDGMENHNQFFVGPNCGKNYFISNDNNLSLSKYVIPRHFGLGSICLIFLYNTHYFYNNKKSKIQIYPDSVFLRPPPVLS